jgi:hypothetical protein
VTIQKGIPAISSQALRAFRAATPELIKETVSRSLKSAADIKPPGEQAENTLTAGMGFTLRMMDSAMAVGEISLLEDELGWAKEHLPHEGVTLGQVSTRFRLLKSVVLDQLTPSDSQEVVRYIDWMIAKLVEMTPKPDLG